jgi:hypothetical protein
VHEEGSAVKPVFISMLAVGAIMLCAGSGVALTTSHLASDAEMLAFLSDTIFAAEGRIGDLGGAATFELDLGHDTSHPATSAQYAWQSGRLEEFTLGYNNATGLTTFTLGGVSLYYTTPFVLFGDIFIRTRAVDEGRSVSVESLVLDGQNLGDGSSAVGANGLDILWISGAGLSDGFTLTGIAVLSWTGSPPTQSRLAFQIKIAKLKEIGVGDTTWGAVKALFQ